MRRSEKEIKDRAAIEAIIKRSLVCRLGLCDGQRPYVVPVSFGYEDGVLYIHSTAQGKKIELIGRNENVCFEFDLDVAVVEHELPCEWGMRYRSVIGFGKASFIEDAEAKKAALQIIMRQYSQGEFTFSTLSLEAVAVVRIDIEKMTGKESGNS